MRQIVRIRVYMHTYYFDSVESLRKVAFLKVHTTNDRNPFDNRKTAETKRFRRTATRHRFRRRRRRRHFARLEIWRTCVFARRTWRTMLLLRSADDSAPTRFVFVFVTAARAIYATRRPRKRTRFSARQSIIIIMITIMILL